MPPRAHAYLASAHARPPSHACLSDARARARARPRLRLRPSSPSKVLYRSELEESAADTSYVLRIPNSGGALIDGKPYADVIRSNPHNPGAWGRYYPPDGCPEWRQGVASMANDPRDVKKYNSKLQFCRRQGANKALCDLAPMRAILFATREIKLGEEIYYNYGSDKPYAARAPHHATATRRTAPARDAPHRARHASCSPRTAPAPARRTAPPRAMWGLFGPS